MVSVTTLVSGNMYYLCSAHAGHAASSIMRWGTAGTRTYCCPGAEAHVDEKHDEEAQHAHSTIAAQHMTPGTRFMLVCLQAHPRGWSDFIQAALRMLTFRSSTSILV
jgi:hypothetical protein